MTFSFDIHNGDLNLSGPGGFAIVTGVRKLVQDLKCFMLEEMGTDPLHPDYGSKFDGGSLPDGTVFPSMFGQVISPQLALEVESEVRRILSAYQQQQINRLQIEQSLYNGKTTFTAGEFLQDVTNVNLAQVEDTLLVRVSLRTSDGTNVSFVTPVGTA